MPAPSHPGPDGATCGASIGLGLLVLTGPALPTWGAGPALLGLAAAAALGAWRGAALRRWFAAAGGRDAALATLSRPRRAALATMLALPGVIAVAVAVRAIGGVCAAVPAAVPGALALLLAAAALARVRRPAWAVAAAALTAALALAGAGVGAQVEASAPGARGFAHGGPILGIHPFQSTAVIVDGHGPFDLPINDYVEPDGSKGYGPAELAEALQRDLAAIAELQFADGPARAYQAFAGASVEAVTLPALRERLDRAPDQEVEPRLVVTSGGVGRRSRVEFVCPGIRNDPRPREPDDVLERMCPDKYGAEASAGLGLTGRWTGYTEGRGRPRLALADAFATSPAAMLWELRTCAWIALALLAALAAWPGAAAAARRGGLALAALAGAVLVVMSFATWPEVQAGWWTRGPAWASPWAPAAWAAAAAVALATAWSGGRGGWPVAALAMLASWRVATALTSLAWARPSLAATDEFPLEALVLGLGDALHRGTGARLDVAEALVATAAVGALVGLVLAVVRGVAGVAAARGRGRALAAIALVVAAGLIVLSRKTAGGSLLLLPALAVALAASSGLVAQAPGRRWARWIDHAATSAVALVVAVAAAGDATNPLVVAGAAAGIAAVLGGLVLLRRVDLPG